MEYDQQAYLVIRKQESLRALKLLGIKSAQIKFWNYPDLECYRKIDSLISDFNKVLKIVDAIFCCPFEGGHPDHDICRFSLDMSMSLMNYSGKLFEYASYNINGFQVFHGEYPKPITIRADKKEKEIKKQIAEMFLSQKEVVKKFNTDIECFRKMKTTFSAEKYTNYPIRPYYEHWAYSKSIVLKTIQKYLSSNYKA
jgi:hypothetical protein